MIKNRKLLVLLLSCGLHGLYAINDQNNLLALLNAHPSTSAKSSTLTPPASVGLHSLLQNFMARQNNVDYKAALKILNDSKIRQAYQEALSSIQLEFLQYSSKILENYAKITVRPKPNLLSLLKIPTTPVPSSGTLQQPSLLDLLQKQSASVTPVQKNNLLQLISAPAQIIPVKPTKSSLLSLLKNQAPSKATAPTPDSSNDLLQLLSPSRDKA